MDAQLNCETCGATFHRYNLKEKYCSATCRAKGVYANRKRQSAKAQQLPSITEQLARSEERLRHLEAQLKDQKEENEALRATIHTLYRFLKSGVSRSDCPCKDRLEIVDFAC
jgi:septal ring factor EnvC (AmiA/AmiB activator)